MSLPFLTQRRTVLLMSDEALYVYKASGRDFVEAVPWDADNFEGHVVRLLESECSKKPVVILNDMIEQHYRKERLAQKGVGALDKTGVVRRKLNMAFPNYPMKAYLAIKGDDSAKKAASGTYIFAAVSNSDQLTKTLSAVRRSVVSVVGFFLLPVESAGMLKKLADKTVVKGKKRSPWTVLVTHHGSGGLRQIVVKNGELALTRMSMVSSDQSAPDQWASEVYQEFEATMSYLSRFGYHKDDGLNVIVISDPLAGDVLQEKVNEDYNYASLTVGQASTLLGMPLGRRPGKAEEPFADVLHAAWVASKTSFSMPMRSVHLDQISKPRKAVSALSVLLLCTALFLGYQALSAQWSISTMNKELSESNQQYGQLDSQYQKEIARVEALGYDIKLMQAALSVYTDLEQKRIDILPLLRSMGQALGRDLHFDEILIKKTLPSQVSEFVSDMAYGVPENNTAQEVPFEATLIMKYPGTTDIDVGNQEVRDLQRRMQELLPRYEVSVTKLLKDYEYVDEIVVEANDLKDNELSQDFIAELSIRSMQSK